MAIVMLRLLGFPRLGFLNFASHNFVIYVKDLWDSRPGILVPSKHLVEPEGSVLILDTHRSPLSALLRLVTTNHSRKKILFFFNGT
jgi:hypothetical protein